jgi:aminoglycoside 6'-N-acetyltransferase I
MAKLWPGEDDYDFGGETVFVFEREAGGLGGFASVSVRPEVEGCRSARCPHVEGWWVDPDLRRHGVGRALLEAIERWCLERGFTELSSDTELENGLSRTVHPKLGYEPTVQIQYFRKGLDG